MSLRRMRTDCLDLYQTHHIVPGAQVNEIWEAFSMLRQRGKVLYFGSSNFPGVEHRPVSGGGAGSAPAGPGRRAVR